MTEMFVDGTAGGRVALTPERQSTRAWSSGSTGESRIGAELDRVACRTIRILHDRRIPGSRANIDHLAITPAGVWVIDAKRYSGRPERRVEGGILRPRAESLLVGRRDRTALVDGVLRQVEAVREAVDAPVSGALCFVDADWPLLGGAFRIRGVEVLWPRRLADLLRASAAPAETVPAGATPAFDSGELAARIASRFAEA